MFAGRLASLPVRAIAGRDLGARDGLGTLGVFERPACRSFGDALLSLAELLGERSPRVLDHVIDHCLITSRGFAECLLGSSSLVRKVHHGPVMIGRRVDCQAPAPGQPAEMRDVDLVTGRPGAALRRDYASRWEPRLQRARFRW